MAITTPTLLLAVAGCVLAAATLEGLVLARRGGYDWRAFAATLGDAAGRRTVDALGLSLAAPLLAWAEAHRIATLPLDGWAAFALLFVGQEFCYYWFHRAAHRVRWFWATHACTTRRTSSTLAAALRLGWTGKLTGTALFFAPLVLARLPGAGGARDAGAQPAVPVLAARDLDPRLEPLEWVFNTPSHHRVHHATQPANTWTATTAAC